MVKLGNDVEAILSNSFFIRTTMMRRRSKSRRVVETTYVWDGADRIYLSGYPGKRDWVANMGASPAVTVHTVEGGSWYDISGEARVLRDRNERIPHLIQFIEHWALRPGFPRWQVQFFLRALKLNRMLRLPWWGPFYFARKIFDQMPCVEITFAAEPVRRLHGPPELSENRDGRP